MGLSIHYRGRIRRPELLPELIAKARDIAEVKKWEHTIFEPEFPAQTFGEEAYDNHVYGIVLSPPECEPLWLSFLSNGGMSSPVHLEMFGNATSEEERQYAYQLSTKTQYAGIECHKEIIHLVRYLENKYLEDFTMVDEGQYWETADVKVLEENFRRYDELVGNFGLALEVLPQEEHESYEMYLERIAKRVGKEKRGEE